MLECRRQQGGAGDGTPPPTQLYLSVYPFLRPATQHPVDNPNIAILKPDLTHFSSPVTASIAQCLSCFSQLGEPFPRPRIPRVSQELAGVASVDVIKRHIVFKRSNSLPVGMYMSLCSCL